VEPAENRIIAGFLSTRIEPNIVLAGFDHSPHSVFVCPESRQDGPRGACSDVFAQVANGGVDRVWAGFRLFPIQHEPLHSNVLLQSYISESSIGNRGKSRIHDYGEWSGLRHRGIDSMEWNRADHHPCQFHSTDGAGPSVGPGHRRDRASGGADPGLVSVRIKHQQHNDDRSIEHCPIYDRCGPRDASVHQFAVSIHNVGPVHSVL